MDQRTVAYYEHHAVAVDERYARATDGVARYFAVAFAPGARILDVGAGTGRDAARLLDQGYAVRAIEPATGLRSLALARHPELNGLLVSGSLPETLPELATDEEQFDGVLCAAVLQHLPRHALFDAAFAIRRMLKPHGRVLVSFPTGGRDLDADDRDSDGRLFTRIVRGELQLLFERCGFATIGVWRDSDSQGRANVEWTTLLFELEAASGSRPLDLVEGILSRRERKVATYKLALFRALTEIALTQPRLAVWHADDRVGVPLDAIASRWVRYYWPIFSSKQFLPQMNGEYEAGRHRLGFAKELHTLIDTCPRGGIARYIIQERNETLDPASARIRERLLSKLRHVIREGPATHAGGSLERGRIFDHDAQKILLDGDLWRELVLMGHWIQDAIVLRWAELTARLASNGDVSVGEVVNRLTFDAEPLRDTTDAREIYLALPHVKCVWTDTALAKREIVVDHVLPFSLWRSNDLWNLLPAHHAANAKKSDRLPEHRFLLGRRGAFVAAWNQVRAERRARFAREAAALAGTSSPSLDVLFDALVEAVEVTALQRGAERWAP